jgi:Spy/CpxP family protein refolding chaperone
MNLKYNLPIISGLVILTTALSPIVCIAHSSLQVAQARPGIAEPPNATELSDLNLTPKQQAQLQAVQNVTRRRTMEILTPEQQRRLMVSTQNRQNPKETMASLDLSRGQRRQIMQLMKDQQDEIADILTPEQLQTLRNSSSSRGGPRMAPF